MAQRLAEYADFLNWGLSAKGIGDASQAVIESFLDASSAKFISYLSGRGTTFPLVTWGDDIRAMVCADSAWSFLVAHRGVTPGNLGHAALEKRSDDANAWLKDVAHGYANPDVTSTTPARKQQGVITVIQPINSDGTTTRGW